MARRSILRRLKCVTCASGIPESEITVVVLGADTAAVASQAGRPLPGVKSVLRVDRAENEHPLAATFAPQLVALAADYSHLFGPSTSFGKDLMPRVAALLGVSQVSDLMMAVETGVSGFAGQSMREMPSSPWRPSRRTSWSQRCAWRRSKRQPTAGTAAVESKSLSVELPSHTRYVGAKSGLNRPSRPTNCLAGRCGWSGAWQRGEF